MSEQLGACSRAGRTCYFGALSNALAAASQVPPNVLLGLRRRHVIQSVKLRFSPHLGM